jgi:two-component system, cell cycle sensor histidine kinase and response regulator CckA
MPERPEQQYILVVDDEGTIRNFVSNFLTLKGYNVLVAATGEEALQLSKDHQKPLHLLLSNIQMPGITGIELGARISRERPETRVMLMSGFEGGMLVLNEGWHFLHKPFVPSQMLGLIKALLSQPPVPNLNEH